jgi:TonB family protein
MVSGDTAGVERASSIEAADTVELSSAAAEDGLVSRVEPEYPDEARRQSIQGAVVLEVHIDRNGAVQEVKLVHGPQVLAEAAAAAVKQWKFRPRIANGHLVEMQTTITLNFKLPQ